VHACRYLYLRHCKGTVSSQVALLLLLYCPRSLASFYCQHNCLCPASVQLSSFLFVRVDRSRGRHLGQRGLSLGFGPTVARVETVTTQLTTLDSFRHHNCHPPAHPPSSFPWPASKHTMVFTGSFIQCHSTDVHLPAIPCGSCTVFAARLQTRR
jgi:hypothetical protein